MSTQSKYAAHRASHHAHGNAATVALFCLTACLWAGGALATSFQTGAAPAAWSVALRMLIAGTLIFAYGAATGARVDVPRPQRAMVALQGVLFFAAAFICFYHAVARIPSGLAALVLSTSSMQTAMLGWLLFGQAPSLALVLGGLCGTAGIAITFLPGLTTGSGIDLLGLAWGLAAALATAGGTLVGARNQKAGVPQIALLGWSALAGAAFAVAWALVAGEPLAIAWSARYVASLAYLSVGASCLALSFYFEVVRRIGPGRAAYALTLVPVVALFLSAAFEGFRVDARTLIGAAAILFGNVLVLRR